MSGKKDKKIRKAIYGNVTILPAERTYTWETSLESTGLRRAYQEAKKLYKEHLWSPMVNK
uniref:Uncharacterized protein n=1 Tax=viral metagenome TaxID=1070528 RepID=A0A6M3K1J0_9ZZZZ